MKTIQLIGGPCDNQIKNMRFDVKLVRVYLPEKKECALYERIGKGPNYKYLRNTP